MRQILRPFALPVVLLAGCGSGKQPKVGPPYTAEVMVLKSVDPLPGHTHFAIEPRTFQYLNDLEGLNGQYIHIARGGTLDVSSATGSIVQSTGFGGAEPADLRYQVKDGVIAAEDYPTLAMLSAYYQFETVFSQLETKLGLPLSTFGPTLPNQQMTVFFEPAISASAASATANVVIKLNAAFVPQYKDFILFQRSPVESLPLSMNLQVIAHEFGHSIFQYSFFKSAFDANNRWENEYAISGINEGWADFTSWQYTGSPDILRASIDIDAIADERNFLMTTDTYDDLNPATSNAPDSSGERPICNGSFYCIGTLFARSLSQTQTELGVAGKDFETALIAALAKLQDTLNAAPDTIVPASEVDQRNAQRNSSNPPANLDDQYYAYDGQVAGAFLYALVTNMPSQYQSTLCKYFEANFSTSGFPTAARAACN